MNTREPQYAGIFKYRENPISMGVNAAHLWIQDPKHLAFTFSRYKFVSKVLTDSEIESIYLNTNSEIEAAWKLAVSDPYPTESELLRTVYKEVRK